MTEALPKILCVDDERNVLDGLARTLRNVFDVTTAVGAEAALEAIRRDPEYTVIMSDLRIPKVDGVAFLSRVRGLVPDAARIMLTGQADLRSAASAVNEGRIFRFLLKPCAPEPLRAAITEGVEYHRLRRAERLVLEQTLHGAVQALCDLLALANPAAFGRATRARRHVTELVSLIGLRDRWAMEVAAMLSQIGCMTMSPVLVQRFYRGSAPEPAEQVEASRLTEVAAHILEKTPRLDEVREILRYAAVRFDGSGSDLPLQGEHLPLGARLLKVTLDFDELRTAGFSTEDALGRMVARLGVYDPAVLEDFAGLCRSAVVVEYRELYLKDVQEEMTFADDVVTTDGTLLAARGQTVTRALVNRIDSFWVDVPVVEPVRVLVN